MRVYGEINFINLSVEFNGYTTFSGSPTGFNTPKPFFDFQFGTELGDRVANNDFSDNRLNGIGVYFCSFCTSFPFEVKGHFQFVVHNAHILSS